MFLIAVYNFLLLNSPSIPFPTSLLQQDKELVELAKNTISPKTPSKRKIIQLFEKTFMIICKKGLAQSSVSRPGMYELIDPMTLTEFIISIVSKALENINTDMGGVRLDYIKTRVSEKFKYLNYNDVSKVIDDLCCKGILYCCGDKEYKLLMPVQH
ncbi:hypothetical protein BD770DRAFT_88218 [Pilaira anomala]|nr:hypothetical protein BD770DRAFT_88218 [Pilaira anomala]